MKKIKECDEFKAFNLWLNQLLTDEKEDCDLAETEEQEAESDKEDADPEDEDFDEIEYDDEIDHWHEEVRRHEENIDLIKDLMAELDNFADGFEEV